MAGVWQRLLWPWIVLVIVRARANALPDITDEEFIGKCVREHNKARSSVSPPASDMLYMTWDKRLAITAKAWAERCEFRHNEDRHSHPEFSSVGENIWAGHPTSEFSVNKSVEKWVSEKEDYNYKDNKCNANKECRHYTQIVWASTHKVGCAAQLCSNGIGKFHTASVFFVCNYGPHGNLRGMHPYNTQGPACSRCTGNSSCQESLCRYDWTPDWAPSHSGRANYVAILITRPIALLFTIVTAHAVHYKYPNVFCYE
ncbi:glioma pathogenesis-related protein 1 [Betta splendens]|uniref:Glioma pathogenesis-related protein 1 n=1 Tax=Betta splendens TaxID=158456 RepID=A0A6P7NI22_BETSP|nr:glioma pathogenesis-related protein 1 [Betta splendens]